MKTSFERYGNLALKETNFTLLAGRYDFQKNSEKKIYLDIVKKIYLNKNDHCLDIGCNIGVNLIPIAKIVKHISGIDHKNCIKILKKRTKRKNITLLAGNFLKFNFKKSLYDKIIIYDVLHELKNKKEAYLFINKAINLLKPDGKILIADLPNISLKKRFVDSQFGKRFTEKWSSKKYPVDVGMQ